MPAYKIYPLDEAGQISLATMLHCVDDAEALTFASLIPGLSGEAEVWEGKRHVGRTRITLPSINRSGKGDPAHREPGRRELGRAAGSGPVPSAALSLA